MTVAKPTYDLVLVRWWDHSDFLVTWSNVEEIENLDGPILINSCGWVVREDRHHLYLAFCVGYHGEKQEDMCSGHVSNVLCLMKKCIESRTLIRKAREVRT